MPASQRRRAPLYTAWDERYRIARKIGAGGFASVYEAVDLELGVPVAIKVVEERAAIGGRVLREVEAAQTLDHPGIVALLDFFGDGERSYLVWELVRGQSLADLNGELDDDESVTAVAEVCDALAYAHTMGVVHRDIKPQNVMVDEDGAVKVMDFGIAQLSGADTLTAEGEMIGTVAYMSPEQAAGRRVGPPSDVYSSGVLLFELLADGNPLRGATAAETLGNVLAGRLPSLNDLRPDLPRELIDAVDAACDAAAAQRPTAAELGEALREVAGRVGGRRVSAQRLLAPFTRLSSVGERGLGAALAALTVSTVVQWLPAYPDGWRLPLAVLAALAWFVVPRAGLAVLLGSLAFPVFNISVGAGIVYLVAAVVVVLVARRRPLGVLWAALALALAPLHATLVAPALAGLVFGRRLGPWVAAWAAAVTYFVFRVEALREAPFAAYQAGDGLGRDLAKGGGPLHVAGLTLDVLVGWPVLFQMAVWAALALALVAALRPRALERRLWIWAASFAAVFALYRVVPSLVWHLSAPAGGLVLEVTVAALITLLPVVAGRLRSGAPSTDGAYLEGSDDEL